jgi:hypothetical protein
MTIIVMTIIVVMTIIALSIPFAAKDLWNTSSHPYVFITKGRRSGHGLKNAERVLR